MTWKAASDKIPWGVVLLLGGSLTMAYAAQVWLIEMAETEYYAKSLLGLKVSVNA